MGSYMISLMTTAGITGTLLVPPSVLVLNVRICGAPSG